MGMKTNFSGGWDALPKPCDACKTEPAAIYCQPDSAFLCLTCDSKIHATNTLATRHARVCVCEVCEQAPAAVLCKADAAALCVACDADIHSANPLARRHDRVPVQPFFDSAEIKSSSVLNFIAPNETNHQVSSWLLSESTLVDCPVIKPLLFNGMDSFLDFDCFNPINNDHCAIHDSVVPVQTKPFSTQVINNDYELDFCRSKLDSFGLRPQSLTHSVSCSSLDVGVVPEAELSYPTGQPMSSGADSGLPIATQLSGMDREARVLRYREKRKNRKFQKTIRYASRKAYAKTRPRIKGRFAKRVDRVTDVDEIYGSGASSEFFVDFQYGVVPTF